MRIPISVAEGHGVREILDDWAGQLETALRERFPASEVERDDDAHEVVLTLIERGTARGEIALRWDPAAPDALGVAVQPAREAAQDKARADALALRVAVACAIAACALWLGAAAGLWSEFMRLTDERDRTAVILIGAFAWVASTAALALLAYYLVQRSHRAIGASRVERGRHWLEQELRPWLAGELEAISRRAISPPPSRSSPVPP